MAKLPPKIPIVLAQDHHQHQHQHQNQQQHDEINNLHQWPEFNEDGHQNPSWVDEFIEFSTAKRGAHRRATSDPSMTAVETIKGGGGKQPDDVGHEQFDKLDDDQLMSMFSTNELGILTSNPSSTMDHNNNTDEGQKGTMRVVDYKDEMIERVTKQMHGEGDSTCMGNDDGNEGICGGVEVNDNNNNKGGSLRVVANELRNVDASSGGQQPVVDPKRIKRILANRQSAQRSRVRKLQYISELERSVTFLQSEVSALSPRVAFLDHQRMILNVDNSAIKAKIAALVQDKVFKDAQQEALKREIERLRQVYYQQSLKKTEETMTPPPSSSPSPSPAFQPPPGYDELKDIENEQLIN